MTESAIAFAAGAAGGWAGGGAADDVTKGAFDLVFGPGDRYKAFIPMAKNVVTKSIAQGALGNVTQWATTEGLRELAQGDQPER